MIVLEAGLLLGLLGDALLRATPWGINLLLWVGAFVGATIALARAKRVALGHEGRWLLACALVVAAAFSWRASPALLALDVMMLLTLFSLVLLCSRGGRVSATGVTNYALAGIVSGVSALFAPLLLLFSDVGWNEIPRGGWRRHALSIMRGLIIGLPLVLIFGALFMAADAIYEGMVRDTLNIDVDVAASHIIITVAIAWLSAGFLRGAFLRRERAAVKIAGEGSALNLLGLNINSLRGPSRDGASARSGEPKREVAAPESVSVTFVSVTADDAVSSVSEREALRPASVTEDVAADETLRDEGRAIEDDARARSGVAPQDRKDDERRAVGDAIAEASSSGAFASLRARASLGVVEVGIALGLLNALFLSFVLVQFRYFFGGADVVLMADGPTYADYARRGFFELVWVATLVLPLLLASHWLLRVENRAHVRVFRGLAMGLLVMLFVVMASALGRMRLYQSEYGLTELRLYTTAFMGWLALVFVWFALTVLRGRRERFACGALVAALAVLATLHALDPDSHIVRTNAALAREGRAFDSYYATSLSADAVPALIELSPGLDAHARRIIAINLLDDFGDERGDWRSWNWSRARASRAVRENEAMLREWSQAP